MRLIDFLQDIRDTSARIGSREAYAFNDANLVAHLTIRTLMRPDVTHYFDSLLGDSSALEPCQALIAYLYLYAYMVNGKPRPVQTQMIQAGASLTKILQGFDLLRGQFQYPAIDQLPLPTPVKRRIGKIFNKEHSFGLKFHYTQTAPDSYSIRRMVSKSAGDACLWLCTEPLPADIAASPRLIYCDLVFTAPTLRLYALYITALI